jgi:hypothetical protein
MPAVVAAFSVCGDTPCPRPWNVRVYLHPPPRMGNTRHPDAPPGLSRDIEGVLAGADAVVVFAGHKE